MTIGKRKGFASKGVGDSGSHTGSKFGGSLSKNDHFYLQEAFGMTSDPGEAPPPPAGLTATGGLISDYSTPTKDYRCHTFTASGALAVTALSTAPTVPNALDYVIIAGGGGGAGYGPSYNAGSVGSQTVFDPGGTPIATAGGGYGNDYPAGTGGPGGSGGGSGGAGPGGGTGGTGTAGQGYGGGNGIFYPPNYYRGGAGGGAGGAGEPSGGSGQSSARTRDNQRGGIGKISTIQTGKDRGYAGGGSAGGRYSAEGAGYEVEYYASPTDGKVPYGGGGGGSGHRGNFGVANTGGGGGGGTAGGAGCGGGGAGGYKSTMPEGPGGPSPTAASPLTATVKSYAVVIGAGGAGSNAPTQNNARAGGGYGGSGVVMIRYELNNVGENSPTMNKASGGVVTQYGGKTIHTFINSGILKTTKSLGTVEYVVLGGGGGGGNGGNDEGSGGGGAGGYVTGSTPIDTGQSISITVGSGGLGGFYPPGATIATSGTPSTAGFPAGTVTGWGGGFGAGGHGTTYVGSGGSGGGGGYVSNTGGSGQRETGPTNPTTPAAAPSNTGNAGGNFQSPGAGAGGGGAGAVGANGSPTKAGTGGLGVAIPATFQNPNGIFGIGYAGPGQTGPTGKFWVAGGGGGGFFPGNAETAGLGGGVPDDYRSPGAPADTGYLYLSSWAGAGKGGSTPGPYGGQVITGYNAKANSGSGGGGTCQDADGYNGGSGLVLIAYPS